VSWATHDLEPYVIQRKLGLAVAIVPLLLGSYSPDILTKWLVYGVDLFGTELKADDPAQFHRGWPGVGFTHSLAFGTVLAGAVYLFTKSKVWALSFLIGNWLHVVSDIGDTMGVMLFFPFTTELISIDAWAYAGQYGRLTDAAAYHSGLGLAWDGFWVVCALLSWRVMTTDYFRSVIVPADPLVFGRLVRRHSEGFVIVLYRAMFFYGIARWTAWLVWAHVVNDYPFDLSWGGPHWVEAAQPEA
jgi:membrane-bound metal-dependent hydrolase YbcI (DUF457 family)